ncbi:MULTISPECIES: holin [Streptomycetaceae]|uniref:Uncharacterized protein n=1 Tax=Streptantibioticus cattleyicolor (strain ATCC 35852 / DSM 46488 / JCM 4925 / NBRC 14057 / NRRL 8057) TaxID=1003195 RepID=F8K4D3_STREN|nr:MULTISPECIES: holin [Streptomycetaceae]AEW93892.1 hypothetical protein SCATT_15210 [Streptantibioticus cattleyicolor NRRL 8057 = DSM 46488]MYS58573.1 hypothetical protein [Streptomyces sp. SID5468]CCB74239.1 protein of unknown function [Streptantibioticus cattleyicolor NRRL 8057 = DSM 46488]
MISRRWLDLGERTISTYVQAVLGLLLADSTGLMSLGSLRAAAVAALPAALAAVKAAFALGLGSSGTASLLPTPGTAAPAGMGPQAAEPDVEPAAG